MIYSSGHLWSLEIWLKRIFLIALVTGGLIYTFRNKHGVQDERHEPLNMRRGFRRIILLLSIVAWLACSCFIFLIWNDERRLYNVDKKDYDGIVSFYRVWDSNRWEAGTIGIEKVKTADEFVRRQVDDPDIEEFIPTESEVVKKWKQFIAEAPDANNKEVLDGQEAFFNDIRQLPLYKDKTDEEFKRDVVKPVIDVTMEDKRFKYKELALTRAEERLKNHERWGNKSLPLIICLSILAALPAGIVSFVFVWFMYFLLRWLILGFRADTS